MRIALALLLAGLVALPAAASGAARSARVTVTLWPEGRGASRPAQTWSLRCGPAGGTHSAPWRACRLLREDARALRAVPRGASCARRSGDPRQALVRGTVAGRRVRASFHRRNACEIARWNRLAPLFAGQPGADTSLEIAVWPGGRPGPSTRATLRCEPPGGTLPQPVAACRRLGALEAPFASVPPGVACTMIWGGPEVALVHGRFRGADVAARFTRADGCEIGRWNLHVFLFA